MSDLKSIIKKIDSLKPVPQVANKVMAIAQDPDSSMAGFGEKLEEVEALI